MYAFFGENDEREYTVCNNYVINDKLYRWKYIGFDRPAKIVFLVNYFTVSSSITVAQILLKYRLKCRK